MLYPLEAYMYTRKALTFLLINILLLSGFPDFRLPVRKDYRFPAQLPSLKELIATPTPAPTPTPKPTPKPTPLPLGKKKVQSTKPGNLTFAYPETAPLNTDPATYTFLVNKEYPMASSYIPYMVEPDVEIYHKGINERRYLQPIAATALEELFAAAEADGYHLVLRCGFRSYKLQKAIFKWNLETYGYYEVSRYHALAGTSEHQTGLAVDLCCEATDYKNNYDILKTPEYAWLVKNAHRYGWILRYPEDKTDITGYNFEPWHFRYVGVELATYLKEQDLVLEEYYGALPTSHLITVPEEYWSLLSEEDYALMQKDLEEYKKKQEEAAQQPTPTPDTDVDPSPDPDTEPDMEIDPTPGPDIEITPTPDTDTELSPEPDTNTVPDADTEVPVLPVPSPTPVPESDTDTTDILSGT